jgi:hypothetical protein
VREFCDAAGAAWKVFRATPHTSPGKREKVLPEEFRSGWLVFECEEERRRLAPIPEDWEELTEAELAQLCMQAAVVPVRSRRSSAPGGPAAAAPQRVAEVQQVLARVIDEVCDMPRPPALDTGELIRVQETLAIAANAAREAVALRRALHDSTQ